MPRITVVPAHESVAPRCIDSAARLAGVEVSTWADAAGEYVLLLPDGATLLPNGVTALLASLDASGSDVAVGTGTDAVGVLATALTRTTVAATPDLLGHGDLGTTLWRRSWWGDREAQWPANPALHRGALARLLTAASAVDVVPEAVTTGQLATWPARRVRRSLRTGDVPALIDRLTDLTGVLGELDGDALRGQWFTTVLQQEVQAAFGALGEADEVQRQQLVDVVADALTAAGPGMWMPSRSVHRLQFHLASRRLLPELMEAVKVERSGEYSQLPAEREGGELWAPLPFRGDDRLRIPREVYRLDSELVLRSRVDALRWEGDRLHVEGYAHITMLDVPAPGDDVLELALVRTSDGRRLPLPVERTHRPDVTRDAREANYRYDGAGFRTWADVRALRDDSGWAYGTWRLEASVECAGVRRTKLVTSTLPGAVRHAPLHDLDDVRVTTVTGKGTFTVEVDTLPVLLKSVATRGGVLRVAGALRRSAARGPAALQVTRGTGSVVLAVPLTVSGLRRRSFAADLPLDLLREHARDEPADATWSLRVALPAAAKTTPVRLATDLPPMVLGGDVEVEVAATPHGRAVLHVHAPRPCVEDVRWDGHELVLTGRWPAAAGGRLVLMSRDAAREHDVPVSLADGQFMLRFSPGAMPTLAGALPLTQGGWAPVVRATGDGAPDRPLVATAAALSALPLRQQVGAKTFTLSEDAGRLELVVGPDLRDDERGAANQHRLRREAFPRFVAAGLRNEVLFESYESRAYADNARAVLEELRGRGSTLRCRWVVVDGQTALPEGVESVRRGSRDYYEALARSRYVVVPNYRPLEAWFESPRDQVVVQTWHGAPFKKIGLDNRRGETFSARDYVAMLRRETASWDYLLSPNPTSTPILRRAFDYDGEMLETGYPRTDIFFAPGREEVAANVRRRLGITDGRRVVLYAPTMRDDQNYGGNRFSLDLQLDLAAARRTLGDDHVLLVRRHAKVVDTVAAADGEFAIDVSLWPDVNELLLATDVLVTDYSSLMFDFANTGRPMLFFTYDLADYRDRLRGLYFDAARMPGPHLGTSAEVVSAIGNAEDLRREYDSTYSAFVSEFCVWDDGKASARFVDRVFADVLT